MKNKKEENSNNEDVRPRRIDEAITFRPTDKEFTDGPLEYIAKIRPIAEKYGICKIVPPAHWRPPFCIDSNKCRFKPRIQRLNELEANNRAKYVFLDDLSKFWEAQGISLKNPTVEGKPLDFYKLYKTVEQMGGFEAVCRQKQWTQIARALYYKEQNYGRMLRNHYELRLFPYVLYKAGATAPPTPTATNESVNSDDDDDDDDSVQLMEPPKKRGRPPKNGSFNNTTSWCSSSKKKKTNSDDDVDESGLNIEEIKCLNCGRGDDEAFILLCDGCDDSYHTFCLFPPLKEVPKGDWRCPTCVAEICKRPTEAYGFSHCMQEYSLTDFGKMANQFKTDYFKKPIEIVTSEEVENEFWNILSLSDKTVEVKYGADLHTLDIGSGFPTKSDKGRLKPNNQPYVNSPWNLNNLSCQDKSVLSLMNVEISGMKVPWAYVGMCFSCFCWHVEDHWSYSINYLHWGEPKTWYGISGADAEKFENVMKSQAPELFDRSPDLLHHLVTIMNPYVLRDAGVPIYRLDQHVGEFVITFPRAYHAGFNQGFNFAEAVNFTPYDWIPMGRQAVESYKLVKRHTVFAHDELVCKIANCVDSNAVDIRMALVIASELNCIIENETRNRLRIKVKVRTSERKQFELVPDDYKTCDFCKTTLFVSAIKCKCRPDKLICLDHYEELCKPELTPAKSGKKPSTNPAKRHELTLLYRYTMDELKAMLNRINDKTKDYLTWRKSVKSILEKHDLKVKFEINDDIFVNTDGDIEIMANVSSKPYVGMVSDMVRQARENGYMDEDVVGELEKQLRRALDCHRKCQKFLSIYKKFIDEKKNANGDENAAAAVNTTSTRSKNRNNDIQNIESTDEFNGGRRSVDYKKRPTLNEIKSLANEINQLVCTIDEQTLFESLVAEAIEMESKMRELVAAWRTDGTSIDETKRILDYLDRSAIEFPFNLVDDMRKIYQQASWRRKLNGCERLTIATLKQLIDEFKNFSFSTTTTSVIRSNQDVKKEFEDLLNLYSAATEYDEKAKELVETSPKKKLEEFERLLEETREIPVYIENVEQVETIVKEAKKWSQQVNKIVNDDNLPYLCDLIECCERAKKYPVDLPCIAEMDAKLRLGNDWISLCHNYFVLNDHHHHQQQQQQQQDIEANGNMNLPLIQVLTPRVELHSQVKKLANFLKTHTALMSNIAAISTQQQQQQQQQNQSSESSTTITTSPESSMIKTQRRPRAKHLLSSSSSSIMSAAFGSTSSAAASSAAAAATTTTNYHSLSNLLADPLVELTGASDLGQLYSRNRLPGDSLNVKYNALQVKELEMMKCLRNLNTDRVIMLRTIVQSLIDFQHQQQQQQQQQRLDSVSETTSENAASLNETTNNSVTASSSTASITTTKSLNHPIFNSPTINFKCCACPKSILPAIASKQFKQCQLCLGLFHKMCQAKCEILCDRCERSKRPNSNALIDLIERPEARGVRSFEANAFQLFVERLKCWQTRYDKLIHSSESFALLKAAFKAVTWTGQPVIESTPQLLKSRYESLPINEKAELFELYLEGFLIESDLDAHIELRKLFYILNKDSEKELENLSNMLNQTNWLEINEQQQQQKSTTGTNEKCSQAKNNSMDAKARRKSKKISAMYEDESRTTSSSAATKRLNKSAQETTTTIGEKRLKIQNKKFLSTSVSSASTSVAISNKKTNKQAPAKSRKRGQDEVVDHDDGSPCAAAKCLQPTGKYLSWIACDKCNKWYHQSCVGLVIGKNFCEEEKYFCDNCRNTNNTSGDLPKRTKEISNGNGKALRPSIIEVLHDDSN